MQQFNPSIHPSMELMVLRSRPLPTPPLRPARPHRLQSGSSTAAVHDSSVSLVSKSAASCSSSVQIEIATSRRFVHSSSMKVSATASVASASGTGKQDVVFVAGSTGKVGSRLVRELLKLGFRVRAGVRSTQRAGALIQSVKQMKPADSTQAPPEERLEIVECDLENQSTIRSAIGSASIVTCCIGASEKEVLDITGPYRIDYKATSNLIQEAKKYKVDHFILLTSLGTGKIGFPAALLNLFWGVLFWKRKAEEELIASGLPYTIVRPGGMERPTDTFKETHNLVLANEDTYFGGLVSNLQVAELMAAMAKNSRLSYCKVVEVIAETTAPLRPIEQLLSTIPSQRPLPPEPDPQPKLETKPEPVQATKPQPQSPYTEYEDLQPPSSPTPSTPINEKKSSDSSPTPSTPIIEPKSTDSSSEFVFTFTTPTEASVSETDSPQVSKPTPQSPYTAYEDLKPPSSPMPSQPKTKLESTASSDSQASAGSTQFLSPYPSYEDLKPPSSPSPSIPDNGTPISISASESQKPYPLSPYTMYEDLKPPSSPSPSVPKY